MAPKPQASVPRPQRVGSIEILEVVLLVLQDHPIGVYDGRVQMVEVPQELSA